MIFPWQGSECETAVIMRIYILKFDTPDQLTLERPGRLFQPPLTQNFIFQHENGLQRR